MVETFNDLPTCGCVYSMQRLCHQSIMRHSIREEWVAIFWFWKAHKMFRNWEEVVPDLRSAGPCRGASIHAIRRPTELLRLRMSETVGLIR